MKKFLMLAVFVSAILITPNFIPARAITITADELQTQISSLNDGIEITDLAITYNPARYSNIIPPGDYVVKITAALPDGKNISDQSDALFSIK